MLSKYMWKKVREMYFNEKRSIKSIARRLSISRNTVRKYIKSNEEPEYHITKEKRKELCEYESEVREYLKTGYIGTVIYENLQEKGYKGSLTSLYRYLKELGWKEKQERSTRFETLPGEQMQYDWTEWNMKIGEEEVLLYVHCLILCFSRMKYYTVSLDKSSESVMRAIIGGMEYFGGYCEKLLIDNPRSMVINHNTKYKGVEYNEDFLLFTGRYRIKPVACRPYRARTKGKVERPFYYLEEHYLRGLKVKAIEEIESGLRVFNEKVNGNFHRTLNRPPKEVFEEEKVYLIPYEKMELSKLFIQDIRKVSNDGYISYKSNFYPVGMKYCNKKVLVENIMGHRINIYGENLEKIESYSIEYDKKNYRPVHPEHIIINREIEEKARKIKSERLKKIVEHFGEDGKKYIEGVETVIGINGYYHLLTLFEYIEIYGVEEVRKAIRSCIELKSFHKNSIKILLSNSVPEVIYNTDKVINLPSQKIRCDLKVYHVPVEV